MHQVNTDMMYLCSCAIRHERLDLERVSQMNLPAVFAESQRQSLSSLTYFALGQSNVTELLPENLNSTWKISMMDSMKRAMLMNLERAQICDWFEENCIWYMPLKGSVLQAYYPDIGLREMSDNDILVDPSARQKIHDYMVDERGYEVYEYSPIESYDDVYKKQSVYIFEMHKRLFEEDTPIHEAYYANVSEKLIPVEGKQYERQFSDEDFYLYVLAHAHRHFEASGTGLRLLVDCYVWNHAKEMNRSYLDEELKKLDMVDFERICRTLSEKMLGGESFFLTAEEDQMLTYMEQCGTFGNEEIGAENRVLKQMKKANVDERTAKRQLFIQRLFPDMHYYEIRAPFVYRHKILIPFYWIWRLIRRLIRGGTLKEVKSLSNTKVGEGKHL